MPSSLTGDFAKLEAFAAAMDGGELRRDIHERAARKIEDVAKAQYHAGQGPSGEVWPVNTSNDRWPSLGSLPGGIQFRATEEGIAATGDDILRYHHDRSARYAHLERRTFPPKGELSPPWAKAADEAATEVLDERLGSR